MKNFKFDLQRFDATYEFTSGPKTFKDSSSDTLKIYYYEPSTNTNTKLLTIGYKETVEHTDSQGNHHDAQRENITLSGDGRLLRSESSTGFSNYMAYKVKIEGGKYGDNIRNDHGNNSTLDGGAGDDVIYNVVSFDVDIFGGENNDYINNDHGNGSKLDGGKGNDQIINDVGYNVDIFGGEDDDTITNSYGDHSKIYGDGGKDVISNSGVDVKIYGGEDDDTIDNVGSTVTIDGGKNDDEITNSASEVTIIGGEDDGDDAIRNHGEKVSINAGAGDDHIGNTGSKVSIITSSGDDSAYNTGDEVSINALDASEEDKKLIYNGGSSVTITAGEGSDSIINNQGSNVTIDTGDGKNKVSLFGGENVYVTTGGGENSIIAYGNYTGGLGDAPLVAYGNYTGNYFTIDAGGGKNFISVESDWHYVTINGGDSSEGVDAIFNESDHVLIKGNKGNDYIKNSGNNAVIFGGDEGDIIENYGNKAFIEGDNVKGAGSGTIGDYIYTDKGSDVTVNGGAGRDLIEAWNDVRASICGGEGNDIIHLNRLHASDYVKVGGKVVEIVGLEILSRFGGKYAEAFSDIISKLQTSKDIISSAYTAENFGSFLKGAAIAVCNLVLPLGAVLELNSYISELLSASTVNGGTGDDTIVADGIAPRIFEYVSGNDVYYHFNDNKLGLDSCLSTLNITNGGKISEVLVNGTDVLLKVGTYSIQLIDGANKKFKLQTAEGITTRAYGKDENTGELICSIFGGNTDDVIEDTINAKNTRYCLYGDSGADSLVGNDKNDTLYGGSPKASSNNDTLRGGKGNDELHGWNKSLLDGGEGHDLIYSGHMISYPLPTGDIPGGGNENIVYGGSGNDVIFNYGGDTFIDAGIDNDKIYNYGIETRLDGVNYVNGGHVTIKGGAGDDTVENSAANVTINGGANNDKINLLAGAKGTVIEYNNGDGNDIIEGFDSDDTIKIIGSTYTRSIVGNNTIIKVGNGSITLKNCTLDNINIDGTRKLPEGIEINGDTMKVGAKFKENKINANDFDSSIKNIDASNSSKGLEIVGNKEVNSFKGSKYNDVVRASAQSKNNSNNLSFSANVAENIEEVSVTIEAGKGNDNIYGDERPIVYLYKAGDGNDVIYNWSANDTLKITGGSYSTQESGNSVIVKVDSGSVRLVNAKGTQIKIDGTKAQVAGLSLDGETLKVSAQFKGKEINLTDYEEAAKIDASASYKALKLVGNANDNTITGSKGNDTLTGGGGKNTFVMGIGKDTVTDYTAGDKIQVIGTPTVSIGKNGDAVIQSGNNSLTLKKLANENPFADGKVITFTDGTTSTTKTCFSDRIVDGDKVTLNANFTGTFDAKNFVAVDASNVKANIKIIGKSNAIIGSTKNDTLESGGNCKLTGGKGSDLFIAGSNDTITDYEATDKISLSSAIQSFSVKENNNVILNLGDEKTLTIENSAGKKISLIQDRKASTNIFSAEGILNAAGTAITLNAATENYTAGKNIVTLDGGLTSGVAMTGNTKNNVFTGSDSADTFIYTGGKDIITNYAAGDKIKFAGLTTASFKGNDLILTADKNKTLTLKGVANSQGTAVTVNDETKTYFSDRIVDGDKVTLSDNFKGTFDAKNFVAVDASNVKANIKIIGKSNAIIGSTKNDTLESGGNCKLTGGKGSDLFIAGSNDTITDYEATDKISLSSAIQSFSVKENHDVILNLGDEKTLTIENSAGKKISLIQDRKSSTSIFTAEGILNTAGTAITLNAAAENYTAGKNIVTLDGGLTSGVAMTGNTKNNVFTGSDSADTFIYAGGKDTITNYAAGDKIKFAGLTTSSLKGNDLILSADKNKTLTLKGVATSQGTAVTVNDETKTYFSDRIVSGKKVTLTANFTGTFDAAEFAEVDATTVKKSVTLNAGKNSVVLKGGLGADKINGGAGNDELWGGKGNDTLTGDAGDDTFIYKPGEGKDTILDYESGDMLTILGGTFTKSAFSKDTLTLTIKGGGNVIFNGVDTSTTFNINGDTYRINGKSLTK